MAIIDNPQEQAAPETEWHALEAADVLSRLKTSPAGLSQIEAAERLVRDGPNRLPEPPRRSMLLRFLSQFHNLLIYVLIGSAAVTALLGHWVDTAVIVAVVVVNALIGFLQEGRAERAMEAIRGMLSPKAAVIRGERMTIPGEDLVAGDIVLLEPGDRVPADLRILTSHGLHIEEAMLTGESVPSTKHPAPANAGAQLGDRSCMAFSGTLVTSGAGRGVVVATGPHSQMGRIGGLVSGVETLTTPLVRQMNVFSRWLSIFIVAVAAIILAYGYWVRHQAFGELFMAVVGLTVAAIPEGLPAVLTITLAVGVRSMAQRNAIVRQLPAIETIGAVSVICTDKTGTLTRNEMMVTSAALAGGLVLTLEGRGYEPEGAILHSGAAVEPAGHARLSEMARAAALCNDASLKLKESGWHVEGDPMEGALLAFAGKAGALKADHPPRLDAIAFDARHRYMATLHANEGGGMVAYVKGAPERIVEMCSRQRSADGGEERLDGAYWDEISRRIAARGERVLAIAVGEMPHEGGELRHGHVESGLTLLGVVGLMDPPRPEAIAAVAECRTAGIRVKMITGDHAATAAAIARQIGLENPERVLTGADLKAMSQADLEAAVRDCDVFARTSPEHKLKLVMALQAHGLTVAMTGDGVNDAPALKRADAGIAMGGKGSEAAKEAAKLVLADDNFASIAAAVREGRTVYDNIRKVISWTLPTNAGEAGTIVAALLAGLALPITPVQILWVNLVTAITLGIALAFESTEENTMRRPPRSRNEPLLSPALAWHVIFVSGLIGISVFSVHAWALDSGYSEDLAQTLAMNTLVVLEIFHLFFVRNIHGASLTWKAAQGTPVVWYAVILVTLAQFAITYLPPMQAAFGTAPVAVTDGFVVVGVGVAFFLLLETEKQLRLAARALVRR